MAPVQRVQRFVRRFQQIIAAFGQHGRLPDRGQRFGQVDCQSVAGPGRMGRRRLQTHLAPQKSTDFGSRRVFEGKNIRLKITIVHRVVMIANSA